MAGRICFIGSGKMAEALIKGLLRSKKAQRRDIVSSDISRSRLNYIKRTYKVKVSSDNLAAIRNAKVIILAVKPQKMSYAISSLKKGITKKQLVISIAAGITLKSLEKALPGIAVMRVMPNNPALIGEGIAAISSGKHVKRQQRTIAEKIFSSVGDFLYINEKHMDAVTALSGSGPAFIYHALSAMIKSGTDLGLNRKNSERLANKTMLGAIKTIISTGKAPEELISMVASKGGTTVAGLKILNKGKFGGTLRKAVKGAAVRSKEISRRYKI
ncbi:pyrroline-5-carboxylate reductase [Candidatus Margulisiibacteriota bacterium]